MPDPRISPRAGGTRDKRVRPYGRAPSESDRYSRFEQAVQSADSGSVPFYRDDEEWYYEKEFRKRSAATRSREMRTHAAPSPEPKEPLISDTVMRVLVGDLAPYVSGALNVMKQHQSARTAATMAGIAGVALVLPKFMK